jgi:hypothetical protein
VTDKQKQKIEEKIKRIKRALAGEKRRFGGFDDSRGIRYLPTELFIKLGDFDNGLKYLKWFRKNFPGDMGLPEFLFEATMICFKTGRIEEAEDYALKTYFSNTFLIDKYFKRELKNPGQRVSAGFQRIEYLQNFDYQHDHDDFLEFSNWLNGFIESSRFVETKKEFDEIEKELETEPVGPRRSELLDRLFELK